MSKNLNLRGRYRTWHFTSGLTPSPDIARVLDRHTNLSQDINKEQAPIQEVSNWIHGLILNTDKPECASFICWRFSRKDVTSWVLSAAAHTPLPILPFEGYIQSKSGLDISRLHSWMPDAIWNPLGEKLGHCVAYQNFCASGDAYEIHTHGLAALAKAGRYKISMVSPDHTSLKL